MSPFFEDPAIYRSVLQDLPIGIYVLDKEQRVRFWNRGAEQITGYLAHEVLGQICCESLPHCDPQGRILVGDHCSVTTTFRDGRALQNHVFTLHKQGHRLGVQVRTLPLLNDGVIVGVAVAFEEAAPSSIPESSGALMHGCLDPLTGIPSQRLTRAVLAESLIGLEDTRSGFGLLRIRISGLEEFSARYGVDSIAPFLRTSVQTIRHSLSAEDFLGRSEKNEFLAMLQSSSPVKVAAMAELICLQLSQSEVAWGGPLSGKSGGRLCGRTHGRQTGIAADSNEALSPGCTSQSRGCSRGAALHIFARISFYVCDHRHHRRVRLHHRRLSDGTRQSESADAAG